jgi:DMSO/TMAO reductase YedYZ heme-binding membrane subunit
MALGKSGYTFLICVFLFAVTVSLISFFIDSSDPLRLSARLFALNGFLFLSIATIMTPFLREISRIFNRSFIRIHHSFAAVGLVLITLHPITFFIQSFNLNIFLPDFSSFFGFWLLAGRQALIVIYIGLAAALLRKRIPKYWRLIHVLMYLALLFGIVHANLIGNSFQNLAITIGYNALFAASVISFFLKRLQQYQIRKRTTAKQI